MGSLCILEEDALFSDALLSLLENCHNTLIRLEQVTLVLSAQSWYNKYEII